MSALLLAKSQGLSLLSLAKAAFQAALLLLLFSLQYRPASAYSLAKPPAAEDSTILRIPKPIDTPKLDPSDVLIVATVDGFLHGVSRRSGEILWERDYEQLGPLVKYTAPSTDPIGTGDLPPASDGRALPPASDSNEQAIDRVGGASPASPSGMETYFIPDPAGEGDLYEVKYHDNRWEIERFTHSVKSIAKEGRPLRMGPLFYTPKVTPRLYLINPLTGDLLQSIGDETFTNVQNPNDPKVFLTRSEYVIKIHEEQTGATKAIINYGEFDSPCYPALQDDPNIPMAMPSSGKTIQNRLKIETNVRGFLRITEHSKKNPVYTKLSSPVVSVFALDRSDASSVDATKIYPLPELKGFTRRPFNSEKAQIVEGEGGPYIFTEHNFPQAEIGDDRLINDSPASHSGTHVIKETGCFPGLKRFPFCVLEILIKNVGDASARVTYLLPMLAVTVLFVYQFWTRLVDQSRLQERRNLVPRIESVGDEFQDLDPILPKYAAASKGQPDAILLKPGDDASPASTQRPSSSAQSPAYVSFQIEEPSAEKPLPDLPSDQDAAEPTDENMAGKLSKKKKTKNRRRFLHEDSDIETEKENIDPDHPSATDATIENGVSELRSLVLTDTILGHGSHGTVVYKGSFEGREVAIKRLLLEFYDVADHEVNVLQDSDHHPNVVRYFYKERSKGFMHIALELCPGSLADVIEKVTDPKFGQLRLLMKPKLVLFQIMSGIHHLHQLKIVHRDIKPQNILVAESKSKSSPHPRILISDFGLCKRLADDQSSFHNTLHTAGGTVGWRAPECLASGKEKISESETSESGAWVQVDPSMPAPGTKISRAIDIFSAGCVFYYVLSGGQHPYGERYSREMNVMKGNFRLERLDALGEEGILAKDLIRRMISKDPKKRPDSAMVLIHPYFWNPARRLSFLQDVSDRFESEERDPPSALLKVLERGGTKVIGNDWCRKIDRILLEDLGKYRKYETTSVRDLLRALRNKKHHYQDLSESARKILGELPDGFLGYFTSRFPNLLLHVYHVVADHPKLRHEPFFSQYFEFKGPHW
ncbi:uncharacterized protein BJ171DRAFT_516596 [Polychytrium aggregatum]|uniref:uncharacterized protein n=1 Tax=Polychytrium aggregatum TaxID=110093 RepID=UPI0022FE35CB|nr:uncharacterized protein BJ171DRAFT_516596 [Polychytrium aggregatum]KAI9201812.1 hypothetical protein BJ171DRAFT_516596 [Polychytrium aggregatum]